MKHNYILAALSLALVAVSTPSVLAADAAKPAAAGQPNADAILKQMSDKLGAAQQFSFKASREISAGAANSHGLQAKARIVVQVKRPNGAVATSTSKNDVRTMYADGRNFTMLDGKENLYATVPMRAALDALPAQLAAKYGFVPPLADFVISNPYKDMKFRAQTITYAGTATYKTGFLGLTSVECYRLALTGSAADSELWIGVQDNLPRKMTATLKGAKAGTTVNIEFQEWNLTAAVAEQALTFTPPKGAVKIPMITTAEAQTASKKQN